MGVQEMPHPSDQKQESTLSMLPDYAHKWWNSRSKLVSSAMNSSSRRYERDRGRHSSIIICYTKNAL